MKTCMNRILDHLVKTRPMTEVVYRPFYVQKGVRQKAVLGGISIDFSERFDKEMPDKKVFIKTFVQSLKTEEAFLNVAGNHLAVWLEDNRLEAETIDERGACYRIPVSKDKQALVIERGLDDLEEILTLTISTVYYRCMDAKDYLTHMKLLSPYVEEDMEGIGISEAYDLNVQKEEVEWNCPWSLIRPEKDGNTQIDFCQLYGRVFGPYAYAYTECMESGYIYVDKASPCTYLVKSGNDTVWMDREPEKSIENRDLVFLNSGEQLLVKAKRIFDDKWGFSYEDAKDILKLPVMESKSDFGKFLLLGPLHHSGPERTLSFTKPYYNSEGTQCFWTTQIKDVVMRPYMDSSFFGQWFYALMVGNYGLLKSAEYLNNIDLIDYFHKGMKTLAAYYEYALFEAKAYGEPTFLQRAVTLDNLDSIGAMGLCLAESYMRTMDSDILAVLLKLADAAKYNIPRFEDGTYHREDTMWADDIFMSLPFLIRMWEITKEPWYIEECFRQIRGYKKRLFMTEEQIFSHIYFLEPQVANRVPWGRGNGWIFITMSDLLKKMKLHHVEEIYPAEYAEFTETYKIFAEGLISCQDDEGMLHQVLNDKSSYQETSCTGMFAAGISYGIQCGILPFDYMQYVEKALEGLRKNSITEDGVILGVCRGSSCSMNPQYYKELGTVDDDDHGTGIILLAMTAYLQSTEEKGI